MTMAEFGLAVDAYNVRRRSQQELAAVHAAWLMNVWSKRKVRPRDLLKDDRPHFERGSGEDGKQAMVESMRRRHLKGEGSGS